MILRGPFHFGVRGFFGGEGERNRPSPPGSKGKRDECVKGPEIRYHGVSTVGFKGRRAGERQGVPGGGPWQR
jgi:hypothetical protein